MPASRSRSTTARGSQETELADREARHHLIHTGWLKRFYDKGIEGFFPKGVFNEPGLALFSIELAKWFHEMEIPSVGSDTIATEQTHA